MQNSKNQNGKFCGNFVSLDRGFNKLITGLPNPVGIWVSFRVPFLIFNFFYYFYFLFFFRVGKSLACHSSAKCPYENFRPDRSLN